MDYAESAGRLFGKVENLFDQIWYDGNYANDDPDPIIIYAEHTFGPSRPRTAGVRFSYEFGE